MIDIVLNWSPNDLINIGIVLGFFLGCTVCLFVLIALSVQKYFDERKKK